MEIFKTIDIQKDQNSLTFLIEEALKELVLEESLIKNALMNSDLKRFIYVPKRIINLVI